MRWLSYTDAPKNLSKEQEKNYHNSVFNKREISYNCQSIHDDDEFVTRHLCYANANKFRDDVLERVPLRIDIGAMFEQEPRRNKDILSKEKSNPLEREFVIDIDMNDYNSIRTCCSEKTLCQKCWKFIFYASEVLKQALTIDFGFKHIIWVFSGRRGIHAWICDERARSMRNDARAAVTNYLNITIGNEQADTLVVPQVRADPDYPLFKYLLVTKALLPYPSQVLRRNRDRGAKLHGRRPEMYKVVRYHQVNLQESRYGRGYSRI